MKKATHELSGFLALGRIVWFLNARPNRLVFLALDRVVWFLSALPSCLVSQVSVELSPFTSHPKI